MVRWVLNSWSALVVGAVVGLAPGVRAAGDLDVAGQVTLRQLPSSAPVDVPLCFDATKGTLGRCFGTRPMLTPGKIRELRHPDWVARPNPDFESVGWRPQFDLARGLAATPGWFTG